jgi:hypothetical protein
MKRKKQKFDHPWLEANRRSYAAWLARQEAKHGKRADCLPVQDERPQIRHDHQLAGHE